TDCSDIDDIIVFREDGVMMVQKIQPKSFVGKNIIHVGVWKKGDKRTIYNMIYQDGKAGKAMMKRFAVTSITRDKEYDLTAGTTGSKVLCFSANPNGEAEVVTVQLRAKAKLKKLKFDTDFAEMAIKGRSAKGNILTKHLISKIKLKEEGTSTLSARKIWYDDTVQRINTEGRGDLLGQFKADDKILTITQSGHYKLTGTNVGTHFDEDMILIEKWNSERPITAIYFEGEKKDFYVKRFLVEDTDKKTLFISDADGSYLELVSSNHIPVVELSFVKQKGKEAKENEILNLAEFISIKGLKALGNKLSYNKVKNVDQLEIEAAMQVTGLSEEEYLGIETAKHEGEAPAETEEDDRDTVDNDEDGPKLNLGARKISYDE